MNFEDDNESIEPKHPIWLQITSLVERFLFLPDFVSQSFEYLVVYAMDV